MTGRTTTTDPAPSRKVVQRVADREGVAPAELQESLFEAIDPDALDALVASADETTDGPLAEFAFAYRGYEVTVYGDGSVELADGGDLVDD